MNDDRDFFAMPKWAAAQTPPAAAAPVVPPEFQAMGDDATKLTSHWPKPKRAYVRKAKPAPK